MQVKLHYVASRRFSDLFMAYTVRLYSVIVDMDF